MLTVREGGREEDIHSSHDLDTYIAEEGREEGREEGQKEVPRRIHLPRRPSKS